MILPYALRLLCLCLASFFLADLAAALVASRLAPLIIRAAEKLDARSAARLLLVFRLLPAALAILLVGALCAPSYLSLEQREGAEFVGFGCLAAAVLGAAAWAASVARTIRAIGRSGRYLRACEMAGSTVRLPGEGFSVCLVEGVTPLLAVAGVVRQRLIVSRPVIDALTPDQLAAAVRHERAHCSSWDNLKRLLILLAPVSMESFAALDAAWARFTEWAADDRAVSEGPGGPLALAEALIRVARLGGAKAPSPLVSAFAAGEIPARVERLLKPRPTPSRIIPLLGLAMIPPVAMVVVAASQPAALARVHELLEHLMH
jgi:Zn-dependent protease with chaperone function